MSEKATLRYAGTNEEVRLGDRVRIRRWLRRPIVGTVTYIPGVSRVHHELEGEGEREWAIQLDDGRIMSWLFLPERLQPKPGIELVARGDAGYRGLQPTTDLH